MMLRRRGLVVAMACLAVTVAAWAGVVLWPALVEKWCLQHLHSANEADRKVAEEKLLKMNSPGLIPFLLARHFAATERFFSPIVEPGTDAFVHVLGWPGPPREDWEKLLKILRANARGAVPVLSRIMDQRESRVQEAVIDLLKETGPAAGEAFPVLLRELGKGVPEQGVIEALGGMGPSAREAIPALVEVMKDSRDLRVPAALALRRIGAPPHLVLPILEETLRKERDPLSRLRAVGAIRFLGPYASPSAPLLVKLLDDQDQQLRFNADHALYRLEEAGLSALIEGLRARSAAVREGCAQNLAELGPRAAGAVPALEKCLSEPDEVVRRAAAGALVRIRGR